MSKEEEIPKAVVVQFPDAQVKEVEESVPLEDPTVADPAPKPKKKKQVAAILKNKFVIINMVVTLGQIWEPIRTWSTENPEILLSALGFVNLLMAKFTGRKLYGDAPKDVKK